MTTADEYADRYGLTRPAGTDRIRLGDNAIADNARATAVALAALADRQTALEASAGGVSSSSAAADAAVSTLITTPTSATAAALASPVAPAPSGGDDRAALQSFLTSHDGQRVRLRQGAAYRVAGTVALGGTRVAVDMCGASITQTSATSPTLSVAGGRLTLHGGTLTGRGSDYADTTATYVSSGIRATAGAEVALLDCTATGHAGAAVYATDAARVDVHRCRIIGVGNGGGGGTFAFVSGVSKDNAGVIVDGATTDVHVTDCTISHTAQGLLGGAGTARIIARGNVIRDIGGQHGIYLNQCVGATIAGNLISATGGAGIKVQTQDGSPDALGIAITGNVIDTTGAHGITLTAAGGSSRLRDITVTGNTIRAASNDGILVQYATHATITGNTIHTARAGIQLADVSTVTVSHNLIDTTTQDGILCQALTLATDRVDITGNRIISPGQAGAAASQFGIRLATAAGLTLTEILIEGNHITDANAKARYLIYSSAPDQSSIRYRRNVGTGTYPGGHGFRGPAGPAREFVDNRLTADAGRLYAAPTAGTPGTVTWTTYGTTAPTTGTWAAGDTCQHTAPTEAGPAGSKYVTTGWVCTAAGTPGTWLPLRSLTGN